MYHLGEVINLGESLTVHFIRVSSKSESIDIKKIIETNCIESYD